MYKNDFNTLVLNVLKAIALIPYNELLATL